LADAILLSVKRSFPRITNRTAAVTASVALAGGILLLAWTVGLADRSFWSGLFATFVGLVLGIPVALWLDRQGQVQVERDTARSNSARKVALLTLVDDELAANRTLLDRRTNTPHSDPPPFLRSDLWRAFAASGEIQFIADASLLATIATAYAEVETTATVERQLMQTMSDPLSVTTNWTSVQSDAGKASPEVALRSVLSSIDGRTIEAIEKARVAINAALTTEGMSET
jgi:hypothetical protein